MSVVVLVSVVNVVAIVVSPSELIWLYYSLSNSGMASALNIPVVKYTTNPTVKAILPNIAPIMRLI